MTYGITDDGSFRRPSETEIVESLEREQIASIDPTLDVATDPVIGPINRIIAGKLDEAWAALETIASGHDPNKATGDLLISLGKITLTKKLGATHTTVPLTCTFEKAGVLLEAGVHLANVENDLGVRFTPVENFTSPSSGNHAVPSRRARSSRSRTPSRSLPRPSPAGPT
jgi:hypothetical protein